MESEAIFLKQYKRHKPLNFEILHEFILDISNCDNVTDETIDGLSDVLEKFKSLQRFTLHVSNTGCTDASVAGLTRSAPSSVSRMEIYAERCVHITDKAHQLIKVWGENQKGDDVTARIYLSPDYPT